MKKLIRIKRENGAIAIISVFAITLFLLLTALLIDGGLCYYKAAKLQNAVDASVVAASHYATDNNALDTYAEYYLKENGFDKAKYGDNMTITITKKGFVESTDPDVDDDNASQSGVVKLNVKLKDNGLFAALSGFDALTFDRTSYTKCSVETVKTPVALSYSVFAGSTAYRNFSVDNINADAALEIGGHTSSNFTAAVNEFENLFNNINNSFLKPVLGVNIGPMNVTTAEVVANGDFHSNSSIDISTQSIRSDRVKDKVYDGEYIACTCKSQCTSTKANNKCPVCSDSYTKCECGRDPSDTYGGVIFDSNSNIALTNGIRTGQGFVGQITGSNYDLNTAAYIQNYQYLEITQLTLNIINTMDFSTVNASNISEKYLDAANKYFEKYKSTTIPSQKQAVLDQVNNLVFDSSNKYVLNDQKELIYQVTYGMINDVIEEKRNEITTYSSVLDDIISYGIDDFPNSVNDNDYDYVEQNLGDSEGRYTDSLEFYKRDDENNKVIVVVNKRKIQRDIRSNNVRNIAKIKAGYRYAIYRAYQLPTVSEPINSKYVPIPNMRQYFTRQINRSVKNATTTKSSDEDSSIASATTIKKAVADSMDELKNLIDLEDTLATQHITNAKVDASKDDAYYDDTYKAKDALTNQDTTPLFNYVISKKDPNGDVNTNASNMKLEKYSEEENGIPSFRGETLFNTDKSLKTASDFVKEYAEKNSSKYGDNAVQDFYDDNVKGKYGADKVSSKKQEFEDTKSYRTFWQQLVKENFNVLVKKENDDYETYSAPNEEDVFLSPKLDVSVNSKPYKAMTDYKDSLNLDEYEIRNASGVQSTTVNIEKPVVPDKKDIPEKSIPSQNFTFTVNGTSAKSFTYDAKDIIEGTKTVDSIIQDVKAGFTWEYHPVNDDGLIRCDKNGNSNKNGDFHKAPDANYSSVHYEGGNNNRSFYVTANTSVYYSEYMYTGDNNYCGIDMKKGSTVIVNGEKLYNDKYAFYSKNRFYMQDDCILIINGNAKFDTDSSRPKQQVGEGIGSVVIVDGNLELGSDLLLKSGSTIIVTGNLVINNNKGITINDAGNKATNLYVAGNITYAGGSGDGVIGKETPDGLKNYTTLTNGTTFVVLNKDVANGQSDALTTKINYPMHVQNGAKFYAGGTCQIWTKNNDSFTVEDGGEARFYKAVRYTSKGSSEININVNAGGKLFCTGQIAWNLLNIAGADGKVTEAYFDNVTFASDVSIAKNVIVGIKSSSNNANNLALTNAGTLIIDDVKMFNKTITNTGYICTKSDIVVNNMSNDGIILADGSITVNGNLSQNQTNANSFISAKSITTTGDIYLSKGVIYVNDGDVTTNLLMVNGALLYVEKGSIYANQCKLYNDSKVYSGKDFIIENDIECQNTEVKVVGSFTAGVMIIDSWAKPKLDFGYGDFGSEMNIEKGAKVILAGGNMKTSKIINNGSVYVENSLTIAYLVNNDGADFVCNGDLTLTKTNYASDDYKNDSLVNFGDVYVFGSIDSYGTVYVEGGNLYIKKDLKAATSLTNTTVIEINGSNNNVYIAGWISSKLLGEILIDSGAKNTVLSAYGYEHKTSIDDSTVTSLKNYSTGAKVYLGTGNGWEFIENKRTVHIKSKFINNGSAYVYGNLECDCDLQLDGTSSSASATYVAFDLDANGNDIICGKNSNSKHIVKVYENLTCDKIELYGDSEAYGYKSIANNSSTDKNYNLNIHDKGLVFFGPNSKMNGYTVLLNGESGEFSGKVYIPGANYSTTKSGNYSSRNTVKIDFNSKIDNTETLIGAKIITDANVNIAKNVTLKEQSVVYIGGFVNYQSLAEFNNANGELYLIGDVNVGSKSSYPEFVFNAGCVNYIGAIKGSNLKSENVLSTINPFNCGGNNYIENSVIANTDNSNPNKTNIAGRRWTSVYIYDGETHISGDLSIPNQNRATLVNENTKLSCNNFSTFSTIYNYGEFIILGKLSYTNKGEWSDIAVDKDMKNGACIRNGKDGCNPENVKMYIGDSSTINLGGYVSNNGQLYSKASFIINGFYVVNPEFRMRVVGENANATFYTRRGDDSGVKYEYAPRISLVCGASSILHTSGSISTTNGIYSLKGAVISCETDLDYGMAILNGGTLYVKGNIGYSKDGYSHRYIEVFYDGDEKKGAYSIINGFINGQSEQNTDALFYCGGSIQIGTTESNGDGGTVQNWGSMYIDGKLILYTRGETAINKISFSGQVGSKTFINGDVFCGGGLVTMKNSIYMNDGNLQTKRCVRVNSDEFIKEGKSELGVDDMDSMAYFYVGGNMVTSILGNGSDGNLAGSINTANRFIAYTNSNIYVGGSFCTNSVTLFKENVTMCVDGKEGMPSVDGFDNSTHPTSKFKVILGDNFEANSNTSQFYHIYVKGSVYADGTFRFRDMSQAYIYGDFISHNNGSTGDSQNVEIGKSLSFSSVGDDTWAKQEPFLTENDLKETDPNFDYNYENACYFYVQGNFDTIGRLSIYAGATLKVGGNCDIRSRIQISHDGNLYVGGNLKTSTSYIDAEQYSNLFARGDITAPKYIVVREHSILYCGKKVTAGTSFEGRSYSTIFTRGSLQATLSNIKIRDNSTVFVGGNMTALKYIELGKFDENYKESRTQTDKRTDDNELGVCICDTHCTSSNYNSDCPVCNSHPGDCAVEAEGAEEMKNELGDDVTDSAFGGTFYIGKALVSYTDYIKEYGFSKVVVGKYVYATDYITLRSNADMWVLPEAFKNSTYYKVEWVSESDGSIWGNIIDAIKKAGYELVEAFKMKDGSVYSAGELTLNKNASLLGTYDCEAHDQTILKHDSLVYFGHDFKVIAKSLNINLGSNADALTGFDARGDTYTTLTCTANTTKHSKNYTMYTKDYNPEKTYKCDKCGAVLTKVKQNVTCPVTVYANNEIDIRTTTNMQLTYLAACNGSVNIYDVYSNSENMQSNTTQLPNAIISYYKDINYNALYSSISALFYAPEGCVDLDGAYQEVWGSIIGDTVKINTFYINLHRFENWKSLNLQIAESKDVYMITEEEYENSNYDDEADSRYITTVEDEKNGGANIFFDKSIIDAAGDGEIDFGDSGFENGEDD